MHKPTLKELAIIIVTGLGTVLAYAFTDFGLSVGALVASFVVLAVVLEQRGERRCRGRRES